VLTRPPPGGAMAAAAAGQVVVDYGAPLWTLLQQPQPAPPAASVRAFRIFDNAQWFEVDDHDVYLPINNAQRGLTQQACAAIANAHGHVATLYIVEWQPNRPRPTLFATMGLNPQMQLQHGLAPEELLMTWDLPDPAFPRVADSGVFRSFVFPQYAVTAPPPPAAAAAAGTPSHGPPVGNPLDVELAHNDRALPLLALPWP
jgi:hypothetical protein